MIVATAGHIDHGKTSLVRALTHVDTDRLPEEKRRGISIDLGFAYADLGDGRTTGFVDVPGHERFIRNMVAGVAAIDMALLVVAADDGPRPQTREHLTILDLLGLRHGVVALNKVDRVDAARLEEARAEVAGLLVGSSLEGAPILPVSAATGAGVDVLREQLRHMAASLRARSDSGHFRLSIDRVFTLPGAGLVATGTALSGSVRVGDEVMASPQGVLLRVRSIHAQHKASDQAVAGQRCALNLAGSEARRVELSRGDMILAPDLHAPTARIDTEVLWLASELGGPRALAEGAVVQMHLGAALVNARAAPLESRSLAGAQRGLVQWVLDRPVAAVRGDRFVLRDAAGQRTVGGGWVVDPFGAARGRAKPARLSALNAMRCADVQTSLQTMLTGREAVLPWQPFRTAWNLKEDEAVRLLAQVPHHRLSVGEDSIVAAQVWSQARERLLQAVGDFHQQQPAALGPRALDAGAMGETREQRDLARAAIAALISDGRLIREGLYLRLPTHRPTLSDADQVLLERTLAVIDGGGLRPPIVGELAASLNVDQPRLVEFLQRTHALGHLVQVAPNRYYRPRAIADLVAVARELAAESEDGSFDAAAYRDRSGIGRNLTIQVLEFLDRSRYTRFARNRRWMVKGT